MNQAIADSRDTPTGGAAPRITGLFQRQTWGGRKQDMAIDEGPAEEFDATDAVLLLDRDDLVELEDCSENSDQLGREHVAGWDGKPCSVYLVDSVLAFFGVSDLEDVTEEMLQAARETYKPQPPNTVSVVLSVKVKIRLKAGVTADEVIENLDYAVLSGTAGASIVDTEIISADKA
ncbi:hypothetical protein ABIC83_002382 [Roseateles asaccharophilus]|uniref:hypothetical protein n=1 Tax=Roseateles asaccharophilus TaxID=582607 RepID=UPI00383301ED